MCRTACGRPADVDDSIPGAVAFAAATGEPTGTDEEPATTATRTCGFCRGTIPADEAIDADGLPVGGFEWIGGASAGETEAYHHECVEAGEWRFLAWGAAGVLGDESA